MPRLGGVAIFFPVMVAVGVAYWTIGEGEPHLEPIQFLGLFVASSLVFLLGLYDDIRGANAPIKFVVQILAAGIVYGSGVRIAEIFNPFGEALSLGVFKFPIQVLWLVGLSNAMNLLDGLDGLAAGVSAMGTLTIMIMAAGTGLQEVALIAAALLGALLGFLPFNFNPASIFLGDCGALFLGFFLAALPILGSQKTATAVALLIPIISLGIPIFDTLLAIFRRLSEGRHPFQADRRHIHHRLLDLGLNQRKVVLTLYAVSAVLSALAMFMTNASRVGALLVLLAVGVSGVVMVRRLGLEEFHELGRRFRSIEQTAEVVRRCNLVVSNDTGLMHLAAAMGTPTVGLLGPNSPVRYAPVGPHAAAIYTTSLACSPCVHVHRGVVPECLHGEKGRCLLDIDVETVFSDARHYLAVYNPGPAGKIGSISRQLLVGRDGSIH